MIHKDSLHLQEILAKHPADIAKELEGLPEEQILEFVANLPQKLAGEVLEELRPKLSAELISQLELEKATEILEEMAPDAAADLLEELPQEEQTELLSEMEKEEAQVLTSLIAYPPDTAGGIMSPEVVSLIKSLTVEQATQEIRKKAKEMEMIYYAYVVDEENRLLGVLSMRDLIMSAPQKTLAEIMLPDVLAVRAYMDKEEVGNLFDKYDYLALPVVDQDNRLLGIITVDDIIDVIRSEETEDMQRMVGVSSEERVFFPWKSSLKLRLPWLYINLATAFLAAAVVGAFESTIARLTAVALFMPVIAGQGGNAGSQTVTVIVRGLALGEIEPGEGKRVLLKEFILGIINGLTIGLTVAIISYVWRGSPILGLVVGLAMILNMIVAGIAGVAIPLGLKYFGKDPALASTIFLTTVTDVAGLLFLLGLATLFLRF